MMAPDKMPHGWVQTTIARVTLPFATIDPTLNPTAKFRYIDIGSIDNARQEIASPKTIIGREAP